MKKVVIYGCYDNENLGDDAMMVAINEFLNAHNIDVYYYDVLGKKGNFFKRVLGEVKYIENLHILYANIQNKFRRLSKKGYYYFRQLVKKDNIFKDKDALIFMGGGYINDIWVRELSRILLLSIIAKKSGCKIYFTGQTSGPFRNKKTLMLAKRIYSMADRIILRERYSYEILDRLSINNKILGGDDFYLYNMLETSQSNKLSEDYFILNLKDFYNYELGIKHCSLLAEKIALITGYKIVLVPFGKDKGPRDYEFSIKLSNELRRKNINHEIYCSDDLNEILGVFSNAKFTLGMAYHSIILSLYSGVIPFALYSGEYYSYKIKGALQPFGLEENAINFDNIDSNKIDEIVTNILTSIKKYDKTEIVNKSEEIKNMVKSEWEDIINRI